VEDLGGRVGSESWKFFLVGDGVFVSLWFVVSTWMNSAVSIE